MRLLSVDVGVRNLGACELECGPGGRVSLGFWGVLGGSGPPDKSMQSAISGAVESMLALHEGSGGAGWDHVVIENQPSLKNPRMKAVQTAIHTFLVVHHGPDVSVSLAAASGKNRVADEILGSPDDGSGTAGQRYRRGKRRCVEAARRFLEADGGCGAALEALGASAKKDDMCDALLQGLHYLSRGSKYLTIKQLEERPTCDQPQPSREA